MTILGEAALSDDDKLFAQFADEFEKGVRQPGQQHQPHHRGDAEHRLAASQHPARRELKRIKPEMIDKYMPKK